MRILTRYILREVLATAAVCLAVLTCLLLLGNILREVLDLLANQQAPPALVLRAVLLLIPFVVAFSLPMALLTAVLLVFGRLSSDHELDAVKACGISLASLALPVVCLSLVFSGACAAFTMAWAPACRQKFKEIHREILRADSGVHLFRSRSYVELKDLDIYIGGVDGTNLTDVLVYQYEKGQKILECRAEKAALGTDPSGVVNQMILMDASALQWSQGAVTPVVSSAFVVNLPQGGGAGRGRSLGEMTFMELMATWRRQVERGESTTPTLVQMHRQMSFSLSCVGFALMGVPLAIRAHRRDTNVGVAFALVVTLVYYSFIILAESLEGKPEWRPYWIVWFPNFLFPAMGLWLMSRVENQGIRRSRG